MRSPGSQLRAHSSRHRFRWLWIATTIMLLLTQGARGAFAQYVTPTVVAMTSAAANPVSGHRAYIPSTPGLLLQSQPLTDRDLPDGAQAWRIQYTTTAPDGSPALSLATVVAPLELPDTPMPVIAWNHGAVGLVQGCLPSALPNPLRDMPAQAQAIDEGWVVIATDYQTDVNGVHPFLIGEGEARSTLDAVRALRQMRELAIDDRTVVWGHSQGGHAALWVAMIAGTYAPDIAISGVMAISPPTSLVSLLDRQTESTVAPILAAFLATAFSSYYPDVPYDDIVVAGAGDLGRELASRCPGESLDGLAMLVMLGELANEPLLTLPPPETFRARLEENEPDGNFTAPVVIAQGLDDAIVWPEVTAAFVDRQCAEGAAIASWTLPGQDHLSLVQPGSPLERPLMRWTRERFEGAATPAACTDEVIGGQGS